MQPHLAFLSPRRIARSLVTVLALGLIQTGLSTPAAQANIPVKPTITSITSGATSLTVNMVTSGITATQWRWSITRRVTSGCTNSLGDGVVQSTGSLTSTISITGLTAGCVYSVSVAGFNGVIGEYAESSKLVGGYTNGLLAYHINEVGASSVMTRRPFTTGTCGTEVVANISREYLFTGPTGCNTDGFTSYYLGYIRAPITGVVTFKSRSDDGSILNIQGNNVFSDLTDHGPAVANSFNASGTVSMVAGEIYRIEYWHHENGTGATAILDWEYSGRTQIAIPTESLATDPSVFSGTCPLGLAERCAAGSAYEIKLATNTNMDGMYWIMVNGTPTLTYSIMNSAFRGGGWLLAMKGKKSASDFDYGDALWTNTTTLNTTYPERWKANDSNRDIDAKYGVYGFNKANQIMAIFPEQTGYAGGAVAASTTSPINSTAYGFNWIETTTAMRPWTQYSASAANGNPAGWGGNSAGVAHTGGPTATPSCVNSATTLTNLFSTANRCAFRQVESTYNASEVPYSAIGQGLFYSQTQIRFFGINYGSANTTNRDRARFGFGWNENTAGDEGSNDGTAGIGLDRQGYSSITTGSINNCCATQNGLSGGNTTSTNIPFEMYIRNSVTASFSGNNLRVTFLRQSSTTAGNGFTVSGTNGANTFRMSQLREGISINPTNGVLTVSEALAVGTYQETVTVTDTDGVTGFQAVTIQVLADSSETDTALNFTGTANITTSGTFTLTGDQTWEAWVRPTSACSGTQKTVFGSDAFVMLCISDYWYISFRNAAGAWASFQASQRINYDSWTHLAVVRSGTTASFYINNAQVRVWGGSAWDLTWQVPSVWATASPIYVGGYSGAQYYSGDVDELTIWREARTLTQITDGMYSAPNLGSANLFGYWDFNEGLGSTLAVSRSQISDTRYNFTPLSTQWVNVATTTTSGPYTVVRIPRTLITKAGGWRVPDSVTAVSVLLVGGGGGGSAVFMTRPGDPGGAGGGGGVYFAGSVPVTPTSLISIRVGAGGAGGTPTDDRASVRGYSGATTTFSALSAGGGGAGGYFDTTNQDGLPGTAGGAGGGASNFWNAYDSGSPGVSSSATIGGRTFPASATAGSGAIFNGTAGYAGGGAGGSGSATTRGAGIASSITGETVTYGVGGGSFGVDGWTFSQLTSFGNGGDAVYNWNIGGAQGGSGLVVIRYITASKPIFTQPTNDTTTAGLTDTITVSANPISPLIRNYQWQVSTDTGTTWVNASTGSGITSNTYTTPILDTSTSGSRVQYRVVVTDSDTAGLSIVDTSAAVFIVINPPITFSGTYTSQKYGEGDSDTFTVLNGTGNKTVVRTSTPRTGITWNFTALNTAVVNVAPTVSVGTYLETITATDTRGAQTQLLVSVVVTKADTLTVTALDRSETYTGSALSFTPSFTVVGLKNTDTVTPISWEYTGADNAGTTYSTSTTRPMNAGSYTITPVTPISLLDSYTAVTRVTSTLTINRATRTITMTAPASPLKYGDTRTAVATASAGAGDGTISYLTSTPDSCTVTSSTIRAVRSAGTCSFTATISRGNNFETATSTSVSTTLTKADTITVQLRNPVTLTYTANPAATLPTLTIVGLVHTDSATATRLYSHPASTVGAPESYVALVNSSITPTDVETYTVSSSVLTFSSGVESNYLNVVRETSTLIINQASQLPLRIATFGASVGSSYTIVTDGGSGGGLVTETITAGSTASNCDIISRVLTMTSTVQSFCNILVTKGASRNFRAETATAQITFYLYIPTVSTPTIGSGPNIALNGENTVTVDAVGAPIITSLSATTISLSAGGSLTIGGTGFGSSPLTVKFWRDKSVTITPASGTSIVVPFTDIAAAGAQSGRIMVITAGGIGVSVDRLTINP